MRLYAKVGTVNGPCGFFVHMHEKSVARQLLLMQTPLDCPGPKLS